MKTSLFRPLTLCLAALLCLQPTESRPNEFNTLNIAGGILLAYNASITLWALSPIITCPANLLRYKLRHRTLTSARNEKLKEIPGFQGADSNAASHDHNVLNAYDKISNKGCIAATGKTLPSSIANKISAISLGGAEQNKQRFNLKEIRTKRVRHVLQTTGPAIDENLERIQEITSSDYVELLLEKRSVIYAKHTVLALLGASVLSWLEKLIK